MELNTSFFAASMMIFFSGSNIGNVKEAFTLSRLGVLYLNENRILDSCKRLELVGLEQEFCSVNTVNSNKAVSSPNLGMKEYLLSFCIAAFLTDQVLRYFESIEAKKRYAIKTRALAQLLANANPLLRSSGKQLGQAIQRGEITSHQLTLLCIEQLERTNLYTNAMVASRYDQALEEAREADLHRNTVHFPFWGVPMISKEVFELPGMPFSAGVTKLSNRFGSNTAAALKHCQESGLIILGSGNVSEQCMWMEASNKVYGKTNNVYDASKTVGGSSGGTACVVSALGCPLGVTSDVGGSTRIPSLFNGLFGLKPTGGSVSNAGTTPQVHHRVNFYCQLGPCSRHAEDLFPLLKILAGNPTSSFGEFDTRGPSPEWTSDEVPLSSLCIYNVMRQPDTQGVLKLFRKHREADIVEAQIQLANNLRVCCKSVEEADFPDLASAFDIWSAYMTAETLDFPFRTILAEGKPHGGSFVWVLKELVQYLFTLGRFSDHTLPALSLGVLETVESLLSGKRKRLLAQGERLKQEIKQKLGKDGVMIVPSLPTSAPHHGPLHFLIRASESGATGLFNVLEFPALAVPLGLDRNGMPVGVQIIANHGMDHLCLSVGKVLENMGVATWSPPKQGL